MRPAEQAEQRAAPSRKRACRSGPPCAGYARVRARCLPIPRASCPPASAAEAPISPSSNRCAGWRSCSSSSSTPTARCCSPSATVSACSRRCRCSTCGPGHTGVTLFFVLSAFLLSLPFLDEAYGGRAGVAAAVLRPPRAAHPAGSTGWRWWWRRSSPRTRSPISGAGFPTSPFSSRSRTSPRRCGPSAGSGGASPPRCSSTSCCR